MSRSRRLLSRFAQRSGYNLLVEAYPFRHLRRRRIDPAVALAVGKVDHKPDDQPDEQPQPVGPAESVDHGPARYDPENGHQGRGRDAESAFHFGTPDAHDPYTDAHQDEREERPDAGHFTGHVSRDERRHQTG